MMKLDRRCKTVILGNGEFPKASIPLSVLNGAECVICCDGAADRYMSKGMIPYRIIGDGDSLSQDILENHKDIFIKISDQETNDLTKAVNYLLNEGITCFDIVGASGKREDHALGNISLLMDYRCRGADVRMYTEYGVFIPCLNTCTLITYPKQQVSIINFTARHLYSEDLVYPIRDFTEWWQGTLNEAKASSTTIEAEGEYLVFLNY